MTTDALHQLIRSLNKSEKRYFKLQASLHSIGEINNYVRLFDYLAVSDEYNENQIRQEFAGEAFLNRLAVTKNRLYEHVLQALVSFHQTKTIENKIYRFVQSSEILSYKKLFPQAFRLLKQADRLCEKHGLYDWKIIIQEKSEQIQEYLESTSTPTEKTQCNWMEKIDRRMELRAIRKELARRVNENTEENEAYAFQVITSLPREIEVTNWDITSRALYFQIQSACSLVLNRSDKSLFFVRQMSLMLDEYSGTIGFHNIRLLSFILNGFSMICASHTDMNYPTLLEALREIRSRVEASNDLFLLDKYMILVQSTELASLLQHERYEEARLKLPKIESLLGKYLGDLPHSLIRFSILQIVSVYFVTNHYREAKRWCSTGCLMANDVAEKSLLKILLMNMLMHADQGDASYVSHLTGRIMRICNKSNNTCVHMPNLIKLAARLVRLQDPFDREELFIRHIAEWSDRGGSMDQGSTGFLPFLHWMKAKKVQIIPRNLRKTS
jgi:hypothetical protein